MAAAAELLNDALVRFQSLNDKMGAANARELLGWLAMQASENAVAEVHFRELIELYKDVGEDHRLANVLQYVGELALREADYERSAVLLNESLALRKRANSPPWGIAAVLGLSGWLALRQGKLDLARSQLGESMLQRRDIADRGGVAWCLERFAELALRQGHVGERRFLEQMSQRAVQLLGAAAAIRKQLNSVIDEVDKPDYERLINELRATLDEAEYEEAWAAGRELTHEEAVEFALSD